MSLIDGLKNLPVQQKFGQALYDLLFGDDALERRPMSFCRVLGRNWIGTMDSRYLFPFYYVPRRVHVSEADRDFESSRYLRI